MKVASSKQMRELERRAIEEIGIPALLLMENAAREAAKICMECIKGIEKPKVVVLAGRGNNGGDGLALARHLFFSGVEVGLIFVGDMSSVFGETLTNLNIVQNLEIPITQMPMGDNLLDIPYTLETCHLVVDALFGIGLNRPLEGSFEYVVEMVNSYAKRVVSLDMPSGINADTGMVMGTAVRAHKTITFGCPKQGIYLFPGADYAGEVLIADIGIPRDMINKLDLDAEILAEEEIAAILPPRFFRSNKGTYGRVYVMAGSKEMPGSAVLAATAVYKSGGGLVKACVTESVASVIHTKVTEAVTAILPDRDGFLCKKSFDYIKEDLLNANVLVVGPGLGRNEGTYEFVTEILLNAKVPVVLDADALNVIVGEVNLLKELKAGSVITPHPGEMSRLTGLPISEVLENTVEIARDFARQFEIITVLKDARTIVAAPSGEIYINVTGNSALAKAGTGDLLAGLIGSFIAQGTDSFTASMLANYLLGCAGQLAEEKLSRYGVTATDLLHYIPRALRRLSGEKGAVLK